MVEAHKTDDNTTKIRENKHSGEIRRCVEYIQLKKKLGLSKVELEAAKVAAKTTPIAAATVASHAASVVVAVIAVMGRTAVRSAAIVGHDA